MFYVIGRLLDVYLKKEYYNNVDHAAHLAGVATASLCCLCQIFVGRSKERLEVSHNLYSSVCLLVFFCLLVFSFITAK